MTRPFLAIIARELHRMLHQRDRLLSALVRPLIWLVIIGNGFNTIVTSTPNEDYRLFLVPGLISMSLLFGSMLASLSLVYDRESGVMRMMVIAPFAHVWIILARTISATMVGVTQATILILVLILMGFWPEEYDLYWLIIALMATGFVCANIGMLIATMSKTLENFSVLMNFVIFPMFFLSGALYPINQLPEALRLVTCLNPFSYGVDLMKFSLLHNSSNTHFYAEFPNYYNLLIILGSSMLMLSVSSFCFSTISMRERLLRRLLTKPKIR